MGNTVNVFMVCVAALKIVSKKKPQECQQFVELLKFEIEQCVIYDDFSE